MLGETWISHHGNHGKKARAASSPRARRATRSPKGIKDGDIWGPTDVYGVRLPLPGDSKPLVLGQVLDGMSPTDKPVEGKKNDPMMPVAWVKTYTGESGKPARVFTTTMGARHRPGERGRPPDARQRVLLGARPGGQDLARKRRQPRRRVQAPPFGFNGAAKGRQARVHVAP